MTESKIMKCYCSCVGGDEKLRVGTYEVNELAGICGIKVDELISLGARANAQESPIQMETGWYIYSLEVRTVVGLTKYYLTIDNTIK